MLWENTSPEGSSRPTLTFNSGGVRTLEGQAGQEREGTRWGHGRPPWLGLENQWEREVELASSLFPLPTLGPLYPLPIQTQSGVRRGRRDKGAEKCWWCPLGRSDDPNAGSSSCGLL